MNPSVDGWVSVFPPDKVWPGTSNLNFREGQSPVEDIGTAVNVVPEKSKGLDSSMVTRPSTGVYCFQLETLWPVHVVAVSAESSYNDLPESDKVASAQVLHNDDFGMGCPPTSDMVVVTRDLSAAALVNWFFYVTLN